MITYFFFFKGMDRRSHRTLVLNRLWQAVNIVSLKRAFSLLLREHAQVIHSHTAEDLDIYSADQWINYSIKNPPLRTQCCVRTVNLRIHVPKVLVLRYYDKLPLREVRLARKTLLERDGCRCQYCDCKFPPSHLNMDHVIPRYRGGKTSWENIVAACLRCNTRKANRLPHEAGMQLVRPPQRPQSRPIFSEIIGRYGEKAWEPFIRH